MPRCLVWIGLGFLAGCGRGQPAPVPVTAPSPPPVLTFPSPDAPAGYLTVAPPSPPAPPPAKTYPLPQNRELQTRRETERLARWFADPVEWFDAKADLSKPWVPAARTALTAHATYRASDVGKRVEPKEARAKAFKDAFAVGCDDPLVLGCGYVAQLGPSLSPAAGHALADRLDAIGAPLRIRLDVRWEAFLRAREEARVPSPRVNGVEIAPRAQVSPIALLDPLVPTLTTAAKDPALDERIAGIAVRFTQAYVDAGKDRRAGGERLAALLDEAKASEWLRRMAEGLIAYQSAWDVRGVGMADTVAAASWGPFHEGIRRAGDAFTAAWALDETRPDPAIEMIQVTRCLGSPREEAERWFARAMTADPANYTACWQKLFSLEPKWGGSEAERVAFGRQCAATRNWDARLPTLLLHAHRVGTVHERRQTPDDPAIWADVRELCEPRIVKHPDDRFARTVYASLAARAGKHDLAHFLFTSLDRNPVIDPLTYLSLDQYTPEAWKTKQKIEASTKTK